ncbi:hypothetical protein KM043_007328 [Ampulex compressa]|nr:hypothetical protein KM043_007328 [Ampulex compressa]
MVVPAIRDKGSSGRSEEFRRSSFSPSSSFGPRFQAPAIPLGRWVRTKEEGRGARVLLGVEPLARGRSECVGVALAAETSKSAIAVSAATLTSYLASAISTKRREEIPEVECLEIRARRILGPLMLHSSVPAGPETEERMRDPPHSLVLARSALPTRDECNARVPSRATDGAVSIGRSRPLGCLAVSRCDYRVSDDFPAIAQLSRSRRKDAASREEDRYRATRLARWPRRAPSSAAPSVLRRPAPTEETLATRSFRKRTTPTIVMADLPDISHLTPEERSIIENVMLRQKQEEEQEKEIMRRKQDEVQVLEETIRACSEKHKKAGVELNATCHICLKTKFADGVGHICNYCSIRCCARCGGKVTLRSNKVIWVCILCRKKQELLSKTGQWMTKTGLGAADNAMLRRMQDMQVPGRRMSTSDSGVEMSVSPHSRTLPTPHAVGAYVGQQPPRHPAAYPEDDPSLYRGEIDGLMRQHPQNYQRQRPIYQDQNAEHGMVYGQVPGEAGPPRGLLHPSQQHSVHQTQSAHPGQPCPPSMAGQGALQQQRSFSSSEEERSTPECASDEPDESEKGESNFDPSILSYVRSSSQIFDRPTFTTHLKRSRKLPRTLGKTRPKGPFRQERANYSRMELGRLPPLGARPTGEEADANEPACALTEPQPFYRSRALRLPRKLPLVIRGGCDTILSPFAFILIRFALIRNADFLSHDLRPTFGNSRYVSSPNSSARRTF